MKGTEALPETVEWGGVTARRDLFREFLTPTHMNPPHQAFSQYDLSAWEPNSFSIVEMVQNLLSAGGAAVVVQQSASIEEHLRAVFGYTTRLDQLCKQVAGIDSKLEQVLKNLAELSALRRSFSVPIESLEPEPYEILRPFTAVVMEGEGEFEASVFDLSIFASGETEEEAIANLKGTLIDTVDRLNELPDARLGKGPLRQKNLLNKYIRRVEKG